MPVFEDKSTMRDEILRCSRRQRSKKRQLEEADALCSFFENYYGGKKNPESRSDILDVKIKDLVAFQDTFSAYVHDGIRSYPNNKFTLTGHLENFFKSLQENFGLTLNEEIFSNFNCRDRSERLLKMLKYLHSGEKSRGQIAEDFGISERALSDDLKSLLDGFDFMESTLQISELERKKNTYRSLIHPVFLALNTSEIYAMTVGLKLLSKDTVFEDTLGSLANKVYKQLSCEAKSIVDEQADDLRISFQEEELKFINTYELMKQRDIPFSYFLKESIPCKVTYIESGNTLDLVGEIKLFLDQGEVKFDRVIVQTDSNRHELDIHNILRITKL